MDNAYVPPLSMTILGAIFLLFGALCSIIIALDILVRKGWRTMMGIMYKSPRKYSANCEDPDVHYYCSVLGTGGYMALLEIWTSKTAI